ncbi:GNAT family N-acetyltransferase [Brevibacillus fulvus]|uniref:Acetyltransferase n=1 Tax=Brevibacillus fulvus TaxID=1125967 RepID=A0A938XY01_9BACL|nr:GNAT family N-acetyltransferase [Brevibacillus fulvus]MBM7589931.1 putative acetyltransferase [Brevibacillus fulvus]
MAEQDQQIWSRPDGYTITTDKNCLNIDTIHHFLSTQSYWAKDIARELVEKLVQTSTICYGIYNGNPYTNSQAEQVGFARVVSDLVRFSWLGDVFVVPAHRGRGLSKWMVGLIVEHPLLKGTSFNLTTADAHQLYAQYGFELVDQPENRMHRQLDWPTIYQAHGLAATPNNHNE